MGLRRQELRYKPLKELLLSITADAHRALTAALRRGTLVYNESFWSDSFPNIKKNASELAYGEIEKYMSLWARSVLTSYSSEGVQLEIPFNNEDLFIKFIDWGFTGQSWAEIGYWSINLTAEGFSGWAGASVCAFILKPLINVSEGVKINKITFSIFKYTGQLGMFETPVYDLTKDDIRISQFIDGKWNDSEISSLKYLGDGCYEVTLKKELLYGKRLNMLVQVPQDGVLVGVSEIVGEQPPWSELYFESPYYLSPIKSYHNPAHLIQPFSHGNGKSDIKMFSRLRTPSNIPLGDHITTIISLRRNPLKAEIEWVKLVMGFNYSGKTYTIADTTYPGSETLVQAFREGMRLNLSRDSNSYPPGYFNNTSYTGIIPENVTVWLLVSVQLIDTPYGTTMVECGVRFDSRIELKESEAPEVTSVEWQYNSTVNSLIVNATISDERTGGSAIASARCRLKNDFYTTDWVPMTTVSGRFFWDSTINVTGTISLAHITSSKKYVLEIEAYDIFGNKGYNFTSTQW
jgi:hypothetical protein